MITPRCHARIDPEERVLMPPQLGCRASACRDLIGRDEEAEPPLVPPSAMKVKSALRGSAVFSAGPRPRRYGSGPSARPFRP